MRSRSALAAVVLAADAGTAAPGAARTGAPTPPAAAAAPASMNQIAEQYVRLALAIGTHDADYVDAYYGPPAWRTEADSA